MDKQAVLDQIRTINDPSGTAVRATTGECPMLTEKIEIEPNPRGSFFVRCGDKYNDELTFDEMLGTIAQLCMPERKRCLKWLWTQEQWDAYNKRMEELPQRRMEANDQASNSHD